MARGSLVLLLAVLATGCTRYSSRAQGPFADRPRKNAPPAPAALPAVSPTRPPLALATPPANPVPPGPPGEASPVPPRPPEPGGFEAIAPPQPPRPPAVPEPAAVAVQPRPQPPVRTPAPSAAPAPAAQPPASAPSEAAAALTKLAQTATQRWNGTDTFEAKLTRREVVGRNATQTEEVLIQIRREPFAVYMRNTGEVGRGREVLYNPAKHDDKVHAIVGEGDSRLYKAGNKAPTLSPDSPLVKSKSRRSVREAGPGTAVALFASLVSRSGGDLKYVGAAKRPEFGDHPLVLVEQVVRPGAEPDADRGGLRSWYFDAKPGSPSHGFPILVMLVEAGTSPRELEYYCYSQVRAPAGLTDADFDVARLARPRR